MWLTTRVMLVLHRWRSDMTTFTKLPLEPEWKALLNRTSPIIRTHSVQSIAT